MAQFYKVLKADPLGDPWTPSFEGAKPTQNFWCQFEGVEKNVSVGKQVPNTLVPGEQVYGDLVYAKSQKGNEYWKFKSQKVPDGVQRPASSPAQAQAQQATGQVVGENVPGWAVPLYNMVEYIYKEMKKMETPDSDPMPKPSTAEPLSQPVSKGVEQVGGGTPVDDVTKATLDGIFGAPETPEDVPPQEGQ